MAKPDPESSRGPTILNIEPENLLIIIVLAILLLLLIVGFMAH